MKTLEELIRTYNIRETNGNLKVSKDLVGEDLEFVKLNKQKIIDLIVEKKAQEEKAHQEYKRKLNAIDGLSEIENAQSEWEQYYSDCSKNEEMENPRFVKKPITNIEELYKKYPKAKAYLIADDFSCSQNYTKSSIGDKALSRILNGEDYNIVINEMKKEWSDYCENKMFND